MKVLVTGANGFLAANVIRELLARDYQVRGMLRKGCNMQSLIGLEFEKNEGDITNYNNVCRAVEGCDIVIHIAASTSQAYTSALPLAPVNIFGVANVIKAIKKDGNVKRMVFVSTANTISQGTKDRPGTERNGPDPLYKRSGYALSKLKAEQLVLDEVHKGNIEAVIVNPTFMLGAYDAKPSSGKMIQLYWKKKVKFYPGGGKNFLHVQSAAIAICNAIHQGSNGDRYLLAGQSLSFVEFLKRLDKAANCKSLKIKIPGFVMKFLGGMGSIINSLGFNLELNYYNACILLAHDYYSPKKAEEELKLPSTDIDLAIKDAVGWFIENDYLN